MVAIAYYYPDRPFVSAQQALHAALAEKGKNLHKLNCEKCNEEGGSSPDDDAGILAGPWMPCLEGQFKAYSKGKRPIPEKMKPKMEKLCQDDLNAQVNYYGSLQ
jgi:cytochrome subunit of sulfide dehydrogenase